MEQDSLRLLAVSCVQMTKKLAFTRIIKELVRNYMVVERLVLLPLNNLTWLVARQILLVSLKGQET
jgi:hypothetical protein